MILRFIPFITVIHASCSPRLEVNDFNPYSAQRLDPLIPAYMLNKGDLLVYSGRFTVDGQVNSSVETSDSIALPVVMIDRVAPVNGDHESLVHFYLRADQRGRYTVVAHETEGSKQTAEFIFNLSVR